MIQWARFVPKAKMIGSKLGSKAKFYASQGASKIGLGVKERFNLSMKYQKAKKKLSNKAFDIKTATMKGVSKGKAFGVRQKAKFDNLSPANKILAGSAVVGLGVGIPVKGAAFYYGAREGAAALEKRKQKKNVKKNRKTS